MNGDLIFLDFENREKSEKTGESNQTPSQSREGKTESHLEKIKRLSAQIESGDYKIDAENLAEILSEKLLEDVDLED